MPVDIHLSEDQTHLVYHMSDPLTMEQLFTAYHQEKEYRDTVPHVLHSIIDMSQLKRIPPNWLFAKAGPGLTHPRSGEMLFVGVSVGIKMILQTILKIVRYERIRFFDTRAEADNYLALMINRTQERLARTK